MKFFSTVLIRDEAGRYLVLQCRDKNDEWRFPGGKIDNGETSRDAAQRELYEETGLYANRFDLAFLKQSSVVVDSGYWYGFVYTAPNTLGNPRILEPTKHRTFAWMFPVELKNLGSEWEADLAFENERKLAIAQ